MIELYIQIQWEIKGKINHIKVKNFITIAKIAVFFLLNVSK